MRRFAFIEVPPPSPNVLRKILYREFSNALHEIPGSLHNFWRDLESKMSSVFADPETGLFAAGMAVGAAIPLSIIRYLKERLVVVSEGSFSSEMLILEGLEMFLFPQFEGRRRESNRLREDLAKALGLPEDSELYLRLNRSLLSWTGGGGER